MVGEYIGRDGARQALVEQSKVGHAATEHDDVGVKDVCDYGQTPGQAINVPV